MSHINTTAIENMQFIEEDSLRQLHDHCKESDNYAPLIRHLGFHFSSRDSLMNSFRKQESTHSNQMNQKTGSSTHEDDLLARIHTPVDLLSLRRTISDIIDSTPILRDALNIAIQSLATALSVDLRIISSRDQIEQIITVLVVVFEVIMFSKMDFVDMALPSICQAAAHLPCKI